MIYNDNEVFDSIIAGLANSYGHYYGAAIDSGQSFCGGCVADEMLGQCTSQLQMDLYKAGKANPEELMQGLAHNINFLNNLAYVYEQAFELAYQTFEQELKTEEVEADGQLELPL